MYIIDIILVIIIGLAGFSCYKAGFTRSLWGVFAISSGIFVASQLWQHLANLLQKIIVNEGFAKWISIIAIVVITSILVDKLFEKINDIIDKGILGWLNRLLGLGIGIVSSALIIAILLKLFIPYVGENYKSEIENSIIVSPLLKIGDEVWTFGKDNLQKHFETE